MSSDSSLACCSDGRISGGDSTQFCAAAKGTQIARSTASSELCIRQNALLSTDRDSSASRVLRAACLGYVVCFWGSGGAMRVVGFDIRCDLT